jgi:hypothetical protein
MEARIERSKEVRSGVRKLSPNKNVQSSNKDFQSTRKEKRRRWAKKSKPVAKAIAPKLNVKEYVCVCHGEAARKPKAGQKEVAKDPESGKLKDTTKGLGHWRCSVTNKGTKVTPRAPQPKVVVPYAGEVIVVTPTS